MVKDIARQQLSAVNRIIAMRTLKELEKLLASDESVALVGTCTVGGRDGGLMATNRRLLWGSGKKLAQIALEEIEGADAEETSGGSGRLLLVNAGQPVAIEGVRPRGRSAHFVQLIRRAGGIAEAPQGSLRIDPTNSELQITASNLDSRVKRVLEDNLRDDERVRVVIPGAFDQAIVGTDTRVFIVKPGYAAGASFGVETTSWNYRNLLGVQVHKGFSRGAVLLQAPGQSGTNTRYWGGGKESSLEAPNAIPVATDWPLVEQGAATLRSLIDAAQTPAVQPPVGESSLAGELEKLSQLRDAGVLSEEEFAAAKQRLLAG